MIKTIALLLCGLLVFPLDSFSARVDIIEGDDSTLTGGWTDDGTTVRLTTSTDNVGIGNSAPQGILDVGTSPGQGLIVRNNFRVGIGTTAPQNKLDVSGNMVIGTYAGSNTAPANGLLVSGNVGIAKTNPAQALDVSGTIAGTTITGANVTSGSDPGHTHTSDSITEVDPNAILTNGTRGLSGHWYNANYNIATYGNVGIGNTNPTAKLLVTGNIQSDTLNTSTLVVGSLSGLLKGTSGTVSAITDNSANWDTAYTDRLKWDGGATGLVAATGRTSLELGSIALLSSIDISANTNLSGDTENVLTGDVLSIGSGITRDTEWNGLDFLVGTSTAALSGEIVAGTAPGGELGGTWASPTVDATHSGSAHHSAVTLGAGNHSSLALSGQELTLTVAKDIVAGTGLSGGEDNVLPGADADTTLTFDATELSALTWSAGGSAQFSWTYDLSGTDPKINFNNNAISIETGNLGIGTTAPIALLQAGTSPNPGLAVFAGGNIGIGTTSPVGTLHLGSSQSTPPLFVASLTGNVGIGKTGPGQKLDVNGTIQATDLLVTAFSDVTTGNFSTSAHGLVPKGTNVGNFLKDDGTWAATSGSSQWVTSGSDIGYPNSAAGNVGIGVTNPGGRLYIRGTGTTTGFAFRIADSAPTDRLVVLDNGNVGIGTTSPAYELDVFKSEAGGLVDFRVGNSETANSASGARAIVMADGASAGDPRVVLSVNAVTEYNIGIDNSDSDKLKISSGSDPSAGTNFLTIQSDGNVGIGTTAPTTLLQVAGTANATTLQEGGIGVPNVNDNLSVFASTTSSQLAGVISDETGTAGKVVFDTSPVLVTPTLGAATATTLDTGQGAYELYAMNQDVQTTSNVTFDILRASTAPNGGLKVLTGGNVGIGTTAPGALLEVAGDVLLTGTTPSITIGDAGAEDTQVNFDGNAQDYHIGLDDTDDSLKLGLGTALGTTDHIVSDSSGRVTMPLQPCFSVTVDSTQTNFAIDSVVQILWQTEVFDIGNNFASNTFTAPVTGYYLLATNIDIDQLDTAATGYNVRITTSNRTYLSSVWPFGFSADALYPFSICVVADMDVNDTATVSVFQSGGAQQGDIHTYTYFTGTLLN